MSVRVPSKYQVVIPEKVRQVLKLKPGMQIEVITKGGIAYLVPVRSFDEIQKKLAGRVDGKNIREKKIHQKISSCIST